MSLDPALSDYLELSPVSGLVCVLPYFFVYIHRIFAGRFGGGFILF